MSIPFTLSPYRYSNDPARMRAFLEELGLRPLLSSGSGYALLRAGAGLVAVHPVDQMTPGETHLAFHVRSSEQAVQELREAGLDPVHWYESNGQHAGVAEPCGGGIWINEDMSELYGYGQHDADGHDVRLTVTAVRSSDDFARDRRFFSIFGFQPDDPGSVWWQALRASASSGIIGLHAPGEGDETTRSSPGNPITGRDPLVRLGFETSEPLEELADRLNAAGYEGTLLQEPLRAVRVTDPDGQPIEIHPAAPEPAPQIS